MIQTIRKAWGIPELKKKIVFTLFILLIFRIGNAITVPYVHVGLLGQQLQHRTVLNFVNIAAVVNEDREGFCFFDQGHAF